MSSQLIINDFVALLQISEKNLFQYGVLILLILGSISCILSVIVFSKKHFRKSPCSFYMIAFHIGSFIYIYTLILPSILTIGFNITVSLFSVYVCRSTLYMGVVFNVLCPCYLIFASIDRILVTSAKATLRKRSTRRLACISIISVTLFWFVCHTHVLIFTNITQITQNYFVCYFQGGLYLTIYSYYGTVAALLVPLLLAILGILAVRNVRQINNRVHPVRSRTRTTHHDNLQHSHLKDRQLIRIVLTDVIVFFLLSFPISIVTFYLQITQYNYKSYEQIQVNTFIQYICAVIGYIPFCIGFYTNLLISKTFRNEFKNIFLCQ